MSMNKIFKVAGAFYNKSKKEIIKIGFPAQKNIVKDKNGLPSTELYDEMTCVISEPITLQGGVTYLLIDC